jgi:chromosomal replication initiation ATPase DnaA
MRKSQHLPLANCEELIFNEVEKLAGVTRADMLIKTHKPQIVLARIVAAKAFRDCGYSFKKIGKIMGKHHSSVMYYMKEFADLTDTQHEPLMKLIPIIDIVNQKVYEQSTP